jgi:hypothetical protein
MIDQISIDLALVPKNGLVKQYLMHHPELRLLVHELFTIVLDEKPDDPVVFIVELFRRMQLELESVSARSSSPVG